MIKEGCTYLITGASGFLGYSLVKRVFSSGGKVRALCRNEGNLIALKQKFPEVEIFAGDISDRFEVAQACKGTSGIFHLAASKHVGLAEKLSRECIKSNLIGSLNILEQSLEGNFDFVLGISTDKAAQVNGVYGATKMLMERLFLQYQDLNPHTKYRIVRYGNIIYSTGSVLCKWRDLLKEGKQVIVTDPSATRFFWTREQAVDLITSCLEKATSPEPWIPEMKSMQMGTLLQAMAEKYLPEDKQLDMKYIGLQRGENLHEKILEEGLTSDEVVKFTVEEIKKLI
jgi:FlaA1/EpsC-like NDP-sugar epimerase